MRAKLIGIASLSAAAAAAAIIAVPNASAAAVQPCLNARSATLCQLAGNAQIQPAPQSEPAGGLSTYGPSTTPSTT
jgi:hypothetical protein